MQHLLSDVDGILDLLAMHGGSRSEFERSKLAVFRSRVSLICDDANTDVIHNLEREFILLKNDNKTLQFASLALAYTTSIDACNSVLEKYDEIANGRKLTEREARDVDKIVAALEEAQEGLADAVRDLRKIWDR